MSAKLERLDQPLSLPCFFCSFSPLLPSLPHSLSLLPSPSPSFWGRIRSRWFHTGGSSQGQEVTAHPVFDTQDVAADTLTPHFNLYPPPKGETSNRNKFCRELTRTERVPRGTRCRPHRLGRRGKAAGMKQVCLGGKEINRRQSPRSQDDRGSEPVAGKTRRWGRRRISEAPQVRFQTAVIKPASRESGL